MPFDLPSYAMGRRSCVQPALAEEAVTITENGTTVLTPETGTSGFSKVTVAVGVAARSPRADMTAAFGYAALLAGGFGWTGSVTIE